MPPKAMLANAKVGAIVFFVAVLERSVAFYRDTLGLPVNEIDGHDGRSRSPNSAK